MKMFKGIRVRLYPTKEQIEMLENHFNGYRFAYNLCLEYKKHLYDNQKINISRFAMSKELLQLRKEIEWLSKCKAECIREAAIDVDKTYQRFFKGNGFPKFKSKKGKQSFTAYQTISCSECKLSFFGSKIKFKTSKEYNKLVETHKIRQCTFKKDSCGDYWAIFLIEVNLIQTLPKSEGVVGIDFGVKELITTSDGQIFENKKFLQNNYYKLRRIQRKFSKAKKGGKNQEKLRIRIAKLNRKICRQKEHYYHHVTNTLLNNNQVVIMETLDIKNLIEQKNLSKQISDSSWGMLMQMLSYKAEWYGRNIIKIDQYFPSSKTCSNCGYIKDTLLLTERTYKCESCHFQIDRDLNAAINIKNTGIKIPKEIVEEKRSISPMKQ